MFTTVPEAAAYLSALIDGEGTVTIDMRPRVKRRRVVIANTDEGIITAAVEACRSLGVEPYVRPERKRRAPHHRPVWLVVLGRREQLLAVAPYLKLRSASKAARLAEIVASYRAPGARLPKSEWPLGAVQEDLAQGASRSTLAQKYSVSDATVGRWKRALAAAA